MGFLAKSGPKTGATVPRDHGCKLAFPRLLFQLSPDTFLERCGEKGWTGYGRFDGIWALPGNARHRNNGGLLAGSDRLWGALCIPRRTSPNLPIMALAQRKNLQPKPKSCPLATAVTADFSVLIALVALDHGMDFAAIITIAVRRQLWPFWAHTTPTQSDRFSKPAWTIPAGAVVINARVSILNQLIDTLDGFFRREEPISTPAQRQSCLQYQTAGSWPQAIYRSGLYVQRTCSGKNHRVDLILDRLEYWIGRVSL